MVDDCPLSLETIRECASDGDAAQLDSLELIFTRCTSLANLQTTPALRSLTAIDTGMVRFGNLMPVGHTLTHLTLIDQMLTRIEPLPLPQLKSLYLQNNRITKIEHLDMVPRLEVLWLSSNRLKSLEGIEACSNLRELWIAENGIRALGGHLQGLARLEGFNIAGNVIADYSDIQTLSVNSRLKTVSFDDAHFGPNPVVSADGYRTFSICYLPQVQRLDGVEVTPNDRDAARGEFTRQVLDFNNRVEAVQKEFEREFSVIDERRHRSVNHADAFREEMFQTFAQLQQLVLEGRAAVASEHERQARVREENLKHLEAELLGLQKVYNKEIDKRVEAEARAAAEEEKLLKAAELRAVAEREQAVMIAELQAQAEAAGDADGGGVIAQHLGEHTPEYQHVVRHFRSAGKAGEAARASLSLVLNPNADSGARPVSAAAKAAVLRCYRVHSNALVHGFEASNGGAGNSAERVYLAADLGTTGKILSRGIGEALQDPSLGYGTGRVMLHADPELALLLYEAERRRRRPNANPNSAANSDAEKTGDGNGDGGDELESDAVAMLVCRLNPNPEALAFSASAPGSQEEAAQLMAQVPQEVPFAKVKFAAAGDGGAWLDGGEEEDEAAENGGKGVDKGGSYAWMVGGRGYAAVLPEYHVLVGRSSFGGDKRKLEAALESFSLPVAWEADGGDLVARLEAEAGEKIRGYMERVWEETNPATADRLREVDENMRGRVDAVAALRGQIQSERSAQEDVLQTLRRHEQEQPGAASQSANTNAARAALGQSSSATNLYGRRR